MSLRAKKKKKKKLKLVIIIILFFEIKVLVSLNICSFLNIFLLDLNQHLFI